MPFTFEFVPEEIPLESAPLVRVLCQVRYSTVPELVDEENERAIASLLADRYPVRGWVQGVTLPFPGGPTPAPPEHFRTFEDTDGTWKVTAAPDFVALETSRYKSRQDFLERLTEVLEVLAKTRRPPKVTRVGMRYTDRIEDPTGLTGLVNPALLGFLPELSNSNDLQNQVVQSLLTDPSTGSQVQVRSLCLPPNVAFDPSISTVAVPSWVLDIDAFEDGPKSFAAKDLVDTVGTLAERAYQVFFWAVTDDFRKHFGAMQGGAD